MNWVGGVTKPEAALQLLGQGGIANRGIAEAGRFSKVRMEHVWVQAYVNWAPSRGARQGGYNLTPAQTPPQHVNPNGPLNAWVPLDASFKQYSYSQGLDLKTAVPLDANALLTAAQAGGCGRSGRSPGRPRPGPTRNETGRPRFRSKIRR
jgi:hypothetical protein